MKVRMPKKVFDESGGGGAFEKITGMMNWQVLANWGVAQKLWMIAGALTIPIIILLYFLIAEQNVRIDFAKKESVGSQYLASLQDVLKYSQQARGLSVSVLSSPEGSGIRAAQAETLANIQKQLQAAVTVLQETDSRLGAELETAASFNTFQKMLQEATSRGLSGSPAESLALYTRFIQDGVLNLNQHVGNASNLILDPDIDSYYMMDALVFKVPDITESLGKLRSQALGIVSKGSVSGNERAELLAFISLSKQAMGSLESGKKFAVEYNPAIAATLDPPYAALRNNLNNFLNTVQYEILDAEFMTASPELIFDSGSGAINAAFALTTTDSRVLGDLLNIRIDGFENNRLVSLIVVAIALFISFAGLVLVIRGITGSLGQVGQAAEQISTGDLTTEVPVTSKDEFGQLGQTFNRTIDQIGALLKEARDVAEQVSLNSNEMMFSSDRMVTGVQTQNEEAAKVAKAIQGVVDSVHQVSETAAGAALAAQRALETAQQGDEAVRESLEGMNRIRNEVQALSKKIKGLGDRSLEIYEIVNTIQEIASQTNLLALNAAIEAAGAGEAGLRFGVVADDVRKLAERSSQATKDIAGLIKNVQTEIQDAVVAMEQGTAEVERDYQITIQAGENLKAIAEVSRESAALSQDISRATHGQVQGAQNVAMAVQSIAKVAGQTEEGVQMTRQTMAELSRLAVQLAESLGRFKLAT